MTNNQSYEIEKKYLIKKLPDKLNNYPSSKIEQGYLCRNPVLRVRRRDNEYILTYKSHGMMIREEYEHPLTAEGYNHLINKTDGTVITKTRHFIPDNCGHTIELDIFDGNLKGFIMAEVEFSSASEADSYIAPDWFDDEVTLNPSFHNSRLSQMNEFECEEFLNKYRKTF